MKNDGIHLEKVDGLRMMRGIGRFMGGRGKLAQPPRPLGSGMSGDQEMPGPGGSIEAWALWSLDGSSVASSFWGLCLWAPEARWSEVKGLYAARAQDVFERDGSMSFGKFCRMSGDLASGGDAKACERFVALASEEPWSGWLSGSMASVGGARRAQWKREGPPILEFYTRALEAAWDGALGMAPSAKRAFDEWQGGEARQDNAGRDLAFALALSGVLCAPEGACVEEKAMAKALALSLGPDERARLWPEVLAKGEARARALECCWGRPEPKLLVGALTEPEGAVFGSKDGIKWIAMQEEDAKALLLAKAIGWLSPKHVDLAIKRCKFSKREAMSARLEASSLGVAVAMAASDTAATRGPRQRI